MVEGVGGMDISKYVSVVHSGGGRYGTVGDNMWVNGMWVYIVEWGKGKLLRR